MSDLPTPPGNNPIIPASPAGRQSQTMPGINKEIGNPPLGGPEMAPPKEVGHEVEGISKEVAAAGVTIHPTTIPIPPPVVKMGVQPTGANIPMPTASAILPISDDQIAQGLAGSIKDSFRWLAEWCLRRLKQVHVGLQSVHGKLMRVTTHA